MERSVLTLWQHFYTSTPSGLSGHSGFQTVARSTNLPEVEAIVNRFTYHLTPKVEGNLPVNWGWFFCGGQQPLVCMHRIADAGNDYTNRRGNFFAHSLFVRRSDLRKIDYDIPCLLRWVRDGTPARQRFRQGGFASTPAELYEKIGTTPEKLGAVPPYVVPVKDIVRLRQQVDLQIAAELRALRGQAAGTRVPPAEPGAFPETSLRPLVDALGPDGLGPLLAAYLTEGERQRRVMLVVGPSHGDRHTALALSIIELLFTLLPYHCRRRLSFATYVEPREAVAGNDRISAESRRVLMTPFCEDVLLPRDAARSSVLAVNVSGAGMHLLPARTSRMALFYAQRLSAGNLEALLRVRDFAQAIDFSDEARGLASARRLCELHHAGSVDESDYRLFARAVARVRRDRSQVPMLQLGHKLNRAARLGPKAVVHPEFSTAYMDFLCQELPRASPAGEGPVELLAEVQSLFEQALQASHWDVCLEMFRMAFAHDRLLRHRGAVLRRFRDAIAATIGPDRAADVPLLWYKINQAADEAAETARQAGGPAQAHEVEVFFIQVGDQLCEALLRCQDNEVWQRLGDHAKDEVLPFLIDAPLHSKEQFSYRCRFLDDIAPTPYAGYEWMKEYRRSVRYKTEEDYQYVLSLLMTLLGDESVSSP